MRYLGVPPDPALLPVPRPPAARSAPKAVAKAAPSEPEALRVAWDGAAWTLPDFAGHSLRDVLRGVQGTGLGLDLQGSGYAIAQSPPAGSRVNPGESVQISFQ